jgi:acetyl-CoA carboxylase biotin carboxyl carrier protein
MTIAEIKELIQVFNESGVGEMEVQRGENRLRLSRVSREPEIERGKGGAKAVGVAPSAGVAAGGSAGGAGAAPAMALEPDANHILVKAPIVGTYYDQPSPDAAPFVKIGDAVEPGQVLCIIESMKLMNEIEAEVAGIVAAKLVENGRPVEYGEALFAIRPR